MASECSFLAARSVSVPAHPPPLAVTVTSRRPRHGAARTRATHRVVVIAAARRPAGTAGRMLGLGSARYGERALHCTCTPRTTDRSSPTPSIECPRTRQALTRSSLLLGAGAAPAALRAEEAEVAVPPSVPVRLAYELQLAGHRYLDVRTEGEFAGGHPAGAVNIPYMHSTGSGMAKNSHFLEQVSAIFGKDDEIIIGCQSGKRSLMASAELCSAGFTAVTDIAGGFSTWRENGLPVDGR